MQAGQAAHMFNRHELEKNLQIIAQPLCDARMQHKPVQFLAGHATSMTTNPAHGNLKPDTALEQITVPDMAPAGVMHIRTCCSTMPASRHH